MNNIIYSKYSNERNLCFQIRTSIIQNNCTRVVEKVAIDKEANKHINQIYRNYESLSNNFYLDKNVKINKCKKLNEKIEFEYIEGKTLDTIIKEYISNEEYEKAISYLKNFIKIIRNTSDRCEFYITQEFSNIFGNIKPPMNLNASKISNIDTIFSNIIVNESWNIIDYEWVFNFPIPTNYVIFRAIDTYNKSNTKYKFRDNVYEIVGINDDEINIYKNMEFNFQKYVIGKAINTESIYKNINNKNYNVQNLISSTKSYELVCYIKDIEKNIYTEENTIRSLINHNTVIKNINLRDFKNLNEIRIDPIDSNCILEIIDIYGMNNGKKIDIKTKHINYDFKIDNKYFFKTNDPQIYINWNNEYIEDIFISYKLIDYDNESINEVIYSLLKLNNKAENYIKDVERELSEKENYIKDVERELSEKENYIKEIVNSRGWKLLQKIKRIVGK